ncbi:MAG: flagellar type III secretion system pore protein FliP [Planctomycetota bacterium]
MRQVIAAILALAVLSCTALSQTGDGPPTALPERIESNLSSDPFGTQTAETNRFADALGGALEDGIGGVAQQALRGAGLNPNTLEAMSGDASPGGAFNPLNALADVGRLVPAAGSAPARSAGEGSEPGLSTAINILLVLTVVSIVPSIILMSTSFMRILIVLALLRQAIGAQSLPPGQVITALALFLTAFIMQPTLERVWNEAVVPYQQGQITDVDELWTAGTRPMRDFMFDQIEATGNWSSLYMLMDYRGIDVSDPGELTRGDVPTTVLVPSYMLSELRAAFVMGFRVYLPFLVIDMVIASLLISMSMMMLPPVLISLPFKLMLFVMVDGWTLVVASLLDSFVLEGGMERLSDEPASAATASLVLLALVCCRPPKHPPRHPSTHPPNHRPGGLKHVAR